MEQPPPPIDPTCCVVEGIRPAQRPGREGTRGGLAAEGSAPSRNDTLVALAILVGKPSTIENKDHKKVIRRRPHLAWQIERKDDGRQAPHGDGVLVWRKGEKVSADTHSAKMNPLPPMITRD